MNDFNNLVLNIAGIVLIGMLIVVGIMLYYASRDQTFPPIETACPTFYQLDTSGNNCIFHSTDTTHNPYDNSGVEYPYSTQLINQNSQCYTVPLTQFNAQGNTPKDVICAKNKWATSCGVYWDGISNNPHACIKS